MSVASKLTQSVRQAKESAAHENEAAKPEAAAPRASEPAPKAQQPRTRKRLEPEGPVEPFPYRRVWPD